MRVYLKLVYRCLVNSLKLVSQRIKRPHRMLILGQGSARLLRARSNTESCRVTVQLARWRNFSHSLKCCKCSLGTNGCIRQGCSVCRRNGHHGNTSFTCSDILLISLMSMMQSSRPSPRYHFPTS